MGMSQRVARGAATSLADTIHCGDAADVLASLPADSVDCVVTSPPYYRQRDYRGPRKQVGQERTPDDYVARLRAIFAECGRLLKPSGTAWLVIGDKYDDLAQLGLPDMRTPISYALSWPNRMPLPGVERLDLAKIGRLDFLPPDEQRFPALTLARGAVSAGGGAPIVLNGSNEVAVAAFLQRRIGFLTISEVSEQVLDEYLDSRSSKVSLMPSEK